MIQFPYGNADFYKIITRGYYYVDRTNCIPVIEDIKEALVFLRPCRFGKTLLLSIFSKVQWKGAAWIASSSLVSLPSR